MSDIQVLISVDYELFFGARAGTVERSLIVPTEALAQCVEREGFRLSLFVDAGFLRAAREIGAAVQAYDSVARQLADLARRGHDVQLHIHPHWQDSTLVDGEWVMRTQRYKLHDFSDEEISAIVRDYKAALEATTERAVFAYRAGGWCMQPFARLASPLRTAGIWIDSTVYAGGYSEVPGREYDFRAAPADSALYRFEDDPLRPAAAGHFLEVPITACRYGASAFWTLAWRRLFAKDADRVYGDGAVMPATSKYYLRRLIAPAVSPVSVDRSKAGLLGGVFAAFARRADHTVFNAMGHPKSLTPRGVSQIGEFLAAVRARTISATYQDFLHLAPTAATGDRHGQAAR